MLDIFPLTAQQLRARFRVTVRRYEAASAQYGKPAGKYIGSGHDAKVLAAFARTPQTLVSADDPRNIAFVSAVLDEYARLKARPDMACENGVCRNPFPQTEASDSSAVAPRSAGPVAAVKAPVYNMSPYTDKAQPQNVDNLFDGSASREELTSCAGGVCKLNSKDVGKRMPPNSATTLTLSVEPIISISLTSLAMKSSRLFLPLAKTMSAAGFTPYQRAVNYLAAAQVYLKSDALLEHPLKHSDIKDRLLGHWGTCPGINLVYSHINRIIKERDLSILLVTGPGHGSAANLANMSVRLVDVETGEVLWSASASGSGDSLSAAAENASAAILKTVNAKLAKQAKVK